VTNAAPFDVFVNQIEIDPPLIALSQQTSEQAMADVLTGAPITAVIKVGDDAIFHIIQAPSATDAEKRSAERIKISVSWRRSLSSSIRPIPATIYTSIDDIEERKRAAIGLWQAKLIKRLGQCDDRGLLRMVPWERANPEKAKRVHEMPV
jgi:hypothetical protein